MHRSSNSLLLRGGPTLDFEGLTSDLCFSCLHLDWVKDCCSTTQKQFLTLVCGCYWAGLPLAPSLQCFNYLNTFRQSCSASWFCKTPLAQDRGISGMRWYFSVHFGDLCSVWVRNLGTQRAADIFSPLLIQKKWLSSPCLTPQLSSGSQALTLEPQMFAPRPMLSITEFHW